MARYVSRLATAVIACLFLSLLAACSDEDDPAQTGTSESTTIGPEGGTLRLGAPEARRGVAWLYVPPGAVSSPVAFDLRADFDAPPPPPKYHQIGPAYTISPSSIELASPVSFAVMPDFTLEEDWLQNLDRSTQLVRLDGDGAWQPVTNGGVRYFLLDSGRSQQLGTFAVHVDTSSWLGGEVRAIVRMWTRFSEDGTVRTSLSASFANARDRYLDDTGGTVRIAGRALEFTGQRFSAEADEALFTAGQLCDLEIPGGAEVPACTAQVPFFAHLPRLTSPPTGTEVDRSQDLLITWDGTGPELVYLFIAGDGPEDLVVIDSATPNDGIFEFAAADLARFAPGAQVRISLENSRADPLDAPGFARDSSVQISFGSNLVFEVP
jgi:hypothetical protein